MLCFDLFDLSLHVHLFTCVLMWSFYAFLLHLSHMQGCVLCISFTLHLCAKSRSKFEITVHRVVSVYVSLVCMNL